jgi:hypothetical protein
VLASILTIECQLLYLKIFGLQQVPDSSRRPPECCCRAESGLSTTRAECGTPPTHPLMLAEPQRHRPTRRRGRFAEPKPVVSGEPSKIAQLRHAGDGGDRSRRFPQGSVRSSTNCKRIARRCAIGVVFWKQRKPVRKARLLTPTTLVRSSRVMRSRAGYSMHCSMRRI